MPARLRGKEALIRIGVADSNGIMVPQTGTFFKVKDFRVTERSDLVEEDFIGEKKTDLDYDHHGWDGSFSTQMLDAAGLDFVTQVTQRDEDELEHPDIVVMVEYAFRDGQLPVREVYSSVVMKMSENAIGGRKEYITHSFEFKAKERDQLNV